MGIPAEKVRKDLSALAVTVSNHASQLAELPSELSTGVTVRVPLRSYKADQGITTNKYVNSSGAVATNEYSINDIIVGAVTAGTSIRIYKATLYAHVIYSKYAFFSDAACTTLISVVAGDTAVTLDVTVTVPTGAAYVAINYSSQNGETTPGISTSSAVPESMMPGLKVAVHVRYDAGTI